mgnify:FL=1
MEIMFIGIATLRNYQQRSNKTFIIVKFPYYYIMSQQENSKKVVDKKKKVVYYRYAEKTKEEKKEKMKRATHKSIEAVKENCTLVNKSSLISLVKTAVLCLLKNINMNKKTEIEPS